MTSSSEWQLEDDLPAPDEAPKERAPMSRFRRPSAPLALFRAVFETTLDDAQRTILENSVNLAIVFTVPSPAWVKPAERFCSSLSRSSWVCIARDGTDRSRHKATLGSDEVASALGRGCCVVGIAPSTDLLPATLLSAADQSVVITGVNGKALARALELFTGKSAEVPDDLCAGLDFNEIASAFRPGSESGAIVERLTRARNRGVDAAIIERLPDLESAHELGPLRTFGLELKRDLEAYRASSLAWSDVGRAILCHSEPGCGKTYGIKAVMAACDVPILLVSISGLFTKTAFIDEVIRGIREVYANAAAMSAAAASIGPPRPVCVCWDECDALPNRSTLGRNADYWRPVITEFMLSMDSALAGPRRTAGGLEGGAIILAGATNYLAGVDAALRRPGRFERIIELGRQDRAGAANVLRHHLRGALGEADIEAAARIAEQLTSAEIAGHVQTARRSARQASRALHIDDLVAAMLPANPMSTDKLFRISIHEAAHAIGSLAVGYGTLRSLSVAKRGISLGRTDIDPPDDDLFTRATIEDCVTVDLCGRVAERIFLSSESVGSGGEQGDAAAATRMIASLHVSAGLGNNLTYLASYENALQAVRADRGIRRAVERDLRRLERRALDIMRANRDALLELAERLMERRHVDGDEAREIFGRCGTPADRILFLTERRPPHAGRYH
ncbi:AAA family ATPase [Bradyrhizobium sp. ORS 86]|uniref:AAA family ATPase n=1 Tax=Bradyrhizobium sp. ORS 86 TaxID=1685970 RepID=UPI00388FBBE2